MCLRGHCQHKYTLYLAVWESVSQDDSDVTLRKSNAHYQQLDFICARWPADWVSSEHEHACSWMMSMRTVPLQKSTTV